MGKRVKLGFGFEYPYAHADHTYSLTFMGHLQWHAGDGPEAVLRPCDLPRDRQRRRV